MNILRQNISFICRHGRVVVKQEMLKTSSATLRNKSDIHNSQSQTISIYDIKNISKPPVKKQFQGDSFRKDGIFVKFLRKIPFLKLDELRIKTAGYFLYEDFVDRLDYPAFFQEYGLSDTFYSWFVVTELHIWMLSTRAMAEDEDGKTLRNAMVECLWEDVVERIKVLGVSVQSNIKEQINELSAQLQASFIGYDEGLLFDDIVLAGALWRRMYQTEDVHPENVEKLVRYIRKQLVLLDNTSRENLLRDKHVNWDFGNCSL